MTSDRWCFWKVSWNTSGNDPIWIVRLSRLLSLNLQNHKKWDTLNVEKPHESDSLHLNRQTSSLQKAGYLFICCRLTFIKPEMSGFRLKFVLKACCQNIKQILCLSCLFKLYLGLITAFQKGMGKMMKTPQRNK